MGNNLFLANASSYFDKIMRQKYIAKSDVITLKRQFKQLKTQDAQYKTLFNKITGIANKAKGKNTSEILQEVYDDFRDSQS